MATLGLKIWHPTEEGEKLAETEADIVFVHGLRGNREATWTKDDVLWPKELLKNDIPNSRIIGYGYDSGIVHADTAEVVQGSVEHDAQRLCDLLHGLRVDTNTTDRPIVTVGHSLGGLVLAQVIYGGDKAPSGNSIRSISDRVVGMLFLGTPFYGSPTATWGESFRRVLDVVRRESDRNTLKNLKPDSQLLKPLRDGFPEAIQMRGQSEAKVGVSYCFEKLKTYGVLVVPEENARYPGVGGKPIPIHTNHSNICKFDDEEDDNYKVIRGEIKKLIAASTGASNDEGGDTITLNNSGKMVNTVLKGSQTIHNQTNNF